jgi:GNAT superfamily N-acetyltransferase
MPARKAASPALSVVPLTPDRFADLERLFGPRGASSGCWCMFWLLPRARFEAQQGEANRAAFREYAGERVPGLLAYEGGAPVGWVAVQPRSAYPRLATSRALARVDEQPVWSLPCFFVAPGHRGKGVSKALIAAAAAHARAGGARVLEAYPWDLDGHARPAAIYRGVASAFRMLGFEEVARREPGRPVMRLALGGRAASPRRARPRRARAASRSSPRSPPPRARARRGGR